MNKIRILCREVEIIQRCGKIFEVDSDSEGKIVRCPKCNGIFRMQKKDIVADKEAEAKALAAEVPRMAPCVLPNGPLERAPAKQAWGRQ
jgi:DNA-directed RNA polymerase subunit RPC12/RpoP